LFLLVLLLVIIYRRHESVAPQGIEGSKVETDSGSGGIIFRAGRNNFQGKVEAFSGSGGRIFAPRGKQIQGKVEGKSGRKMVRWKHFQGKNPSFIWGRERKSGTKYGIVCGKPTLKSRFCHAKGGKIFRAKVETDSGSGGKIFV
jgi:hypothetical protein